MARPKNKKRRLNTRKKRPNDVRHVVRHPFSVVAVPTPTLATDVDKVVLLDMEKQLLDLNAKYVNCGRQQANLLEKINRLNERYDERVREAGKNAGLDMSKNWHYDGPSTTFHPRY